MTSQARLPRIVVVLLLAAGPIGVGHYPWVPDFARPVQPGIGDDVNDLILAVQPTTVGLYYSMYVQLGGLTERVLVPSDHPLDAYIAQELALVELVSEDYDPEVDVQVAERMAEEAIERGRYWVWPTRDEYQYLILGGEGPLRLMVFDDLLLFVPDDRFPDLGVELGS